MPNGKGLLSAISRYGQRMGTSNVTTQSEDTNTTDPPVNKQTRVNILAEMNYRNIVSTNQKYNERIHKLSVWCTDVSYFERNNDLDDFITADMQRMQRKSVWKQLPVSTKTQLCLEFVQADTTIDEPTRSKICTDLRADTTNILSHVEYDRVGQCVQKIDYAAYTRYTKERYRVDQTDLSLDCDF